MNDFHIALLWLRSLEIVIGHSPVLMLYFSSNHRAYVLVAKPVESVANVVSTARSGAADSWSSVLSSGASSARSAYLNTVL
jgi:hypothetical protein